MPAQDVHLDGVSCHFPSPAGPVAAVDGVQLHIPAGQMVTLLGPSGCGKTTTLRLLAGLEQPSAGRIRVGGQDITALPTHARDIGMVFQSYALFPHLNVTDNVGFGLVALGLSASEQQARIAEALALVGLGELARRRPAELSGGQQQRVALARALVLRPALLLLDEPLSNLDAGLRLQMRQEIRALQQRLGLTAVYVTHDQEEALAVSDQIVLMRAGRIAQHGSPRALVEQPADAFVASFIGQAACFEAEVSPGQVGEAFCHVQAGGWQLELPAEVCQVRQGPALLAVRPWAVHLCGNNLCDDQQPAAPGAQGVAGSGRLRATVQALTYLGQRLEVMLVLADGRAAPGQTAGQTGGRVLHISLQEPLGPLPEPGQTVELALHARGCAVVARPTQGLTLR